MEYLKALASLGVWPAIYPLGASALAIVGGSAHRLRFHPLLALATGSAVATLLLMALAQAGAFVPVAIGLAGWAFLVAWCWRERAWTRIGPALAWSRLHARRHGRAAAAAAAIVVAAFFLYAMYPKESLLGERDEGLYAQHALHLLRSGGSAIDLAAIGIAGDPGIEAIAQGKAPELPGLYPTGARWTFQFSAATPVWMAMLAAPLGPQGIFRFNAMIGALNCVAFFVLARRLLPAGARAWAVPALAVFALQPAQVWVSRNSLSEPLCAWFLAAGLYAASLGAARRSRRLGLLAGALIGMGCFVRIDAIVFAALFVYALWIRPQLPPYALIESRLVPQLNGQRDYREASLSNVAAYLSWPVVLAAGLGAALAVRAMLARRLSPARAWVLAFLLVPTVVYLWRPMVSPDHIWAARRWLPAVFPAVIVLAAFAAARLGRRLPRTGAQALAAVLALALGGHLLWQQRDTLSLREDAGMLAQIGAIAAHLPSDRRTYVLGQPQLASALLNGFGVPAVQPPPQTWNDPARFCPAHGECWVVHHPTVQPIAVAGAVAVADLPLRRLRRVTSVEPLAHGTYQEAGQWRVTRIVR